MTKQYLLVLALTAITTRATTLEDTTPSLSDSSRVVDLDEVVVVSQPKDNFLLRQQPVSSTMLGQEELYNLNIRDMRDMADFVPSFVVPNYGSRYTSSMYVRGIGSRVNSPAVGLYIDNVPVVNKSMLNFHVYDVDRIDVLRGAQGTLYGQNSEGGLVRMYTRSPLIHQGTDVRLGVGTGLWRNAEVSHHSRLNDCLGLSLAAFYDGQNGFLKNQATGERGDKMNEGGARGRLVWQLSDKLTFDLSADYQYVDQTGFGYGKLDLTSGKAQDPATNRQGTYKRHMLTAGFGLNYQADWADMHYAASWQYLNDDMLMDIDYRPLDYMHLTQAQLQNAVTQELTLKSRTTGPWHWTTGAFFSYQALKTDAPVYFDEEMNNFLSKTIEDYAYYGMLNAMANRMGMEAAAAMIERAGGCHIRLDMETIPGHFRTPQHDFGLFHESNINVTSRLTATLGLRYDLSQASIDYSTLGAMQLDESVMGVRVKAAVSSLLERKEHSSFGQWLPKFGLTYRLTADGSNVYALVAKGYRAGGYNIQMFSDILQTELQDKAHSARGDMVLEHTDTDYDNMRHTIAFKPEESWNYEFGTHLNLFNKTLQLDLSGYYMQIRNQQLSVTAGNYGFGRMMVNAGKSYSCGVEAMLRGRALDGHLGWDVSYGYTRAVFKEYTDSVSVDGAMQGVSYKDKRVPYIPEHTLSAHSDYRIDLGERLRDITVGANIAVQGKTYWDNDNQVEQKMYSVLGAHVDAHFGVLTLSLWGRNLTDTNYNTFATESRMAGTTYYYAQRGRPFQLGLDVRMHF